MDTKHATDSITVPDASLAAPGRQAKASSTLTGFIRRYRLPLLLAVVAVCLYMGSILYILFGRGQVV